MAVIYKVYFTDGETRVWRADNWEIHKELLEDDIKANYVKKYEIIEIIGK